MTLSRKGKDPMGLEPNELKRGGKVREWGRGAREGGDESLRSSLGGRQGQSLQSLI